MKHDSQDSTPVAEQDATVAGALAAHLTAGAPTEPTPPHASAAIVDLWFQKHFHNMGAVLDERAYALLFHAKEDLKVILAAQ